MSFWSELAKGIAADLATDYVNKRGADGAIEDIGNLAKGVKNFFSDDSSSNEEGNALNEGFNEFMEAGDYEGGINFIKEVYQGEKKDYIYNYYIGFAYKQMGGSDNLNKAIYHLQQSYNNCQIGTDDSRAIKEELDGAKEQKKYIDAWENTLSTINTQIEKKNFQAAINTLNNFYNKFDNGKKDFYYWSNLFDIHRAQECAKEDVFTHTDSNLQFDLNKMRGLANENTYEIITEKEYSLNMFNYSVKLRRLKIKKEFDIANIEIEKYYSTDPNKNINESYWSNLIYNYIEALEQNVTVSGSRIQDLTNAKHCLKQYARIVQTEEDLELRELEELEIQDMESKLKELEGNQEKAENKIEKNISSNDNEGTKAHSENEYLEELKMCYEDGEITDKERRILDRLRKSLGISEERAKELEAQCNPNMLSKDEMEYAEEVKAVLEDGIITDKERRLLNRLAKSLNISEERALEIEKIIAKG